MANRSVHQLNQGELRVLSSLWERGPSTRAILAAAHDLPDFDRDFESVVRAGLVVGSGEGEATLYAVTVTEEAGYRSMIQRLADRLYGGSIDRLVQTLFGGRQLTPQEREDIRRHLDRMD